jgi:hypothetical protein
MGWLRSRPPYTEALTCTRIWVQIVEEMQAALDAQFVIYNAKRSHQGCAAKGRTRSLQHRVPANDNSQEDTAGRADQPDAI